MELYYPWLALVATLVVFAFLFKLQKKHVNFGYRTIIALVLGLILGFVFQGSTQYVTVFGRIFTRLISSIVAPLLFFSIIASVASLKNIDRLKSLGLRTVFWLLLNTAIAATITVLFTTWIKLGSGFQITLPTDYIPKEVPTFIDTIISFFPSNIIAHAASNQVIPIIIFATIVGVSLIKINTRKPEDAKPIIDFFNAMNKLTNEVVKFVIRLTPYAVVSFIASVPTRDGGKDLQSFVIIILVGYLLSFFQAFVVNGVLIKFFSKTSVKDFFKGIWPAQVVAFTSQSSIGSVPVVVEQLTEKLDVDEDIASFVSGLGANMGMAACTGIWPVMLAVFSINALNIPFTPMQYALLIVYSVVVSFGTAGVPGTATIAATAVLTAAGLPLEIIFVLAPISSLVDMARTMANVTGSATTSVIVASKS
ncbi:dicarboxylate/amino acid:cation symporter [Erysipelothrix inopinata]|uniref:Dicarboxylate/amino acid:cation symporter n=1 Tax=Erysipelothrix inopinata TaxID=225084 RepID=A0A7G9RWB8_9FIRM|nr:dicarboxylate/amino acid:cation symporter [Erysipelothrix inopinata]QNN59893.1 dicarboxylate/amino acid:cation symporter [Erysipelothrix inopinata]